MMASEPVSVRSFRTGSSFALFEAATGTTDSPGVTVAKEVSIPCPNALERARAESFYNSLRKSGSDEEGEPDDENCSPSIANQGDSCENGGKHALEMLHVDDYCYLRQTAFYKRVKIERDGGYCKIEGVGEGVIISTKSFREDRYSVKLTLRTSTGIKDCVLRCPTQAVYNNLCAVGSSLTMAI